MPFERPTLQTLSERISADLQSRIDGAETLLRRSVLKVFAKVEAGAHHLQYGFLDYLSRQLFATSADELGLAIIGPEVGVTRTDAVKATGSATATGTTGTVIPAATQLQSASGNLYVTDAEITLAAGTGTLALTADEAGSDWNEDSGVSLTFVSPIAGVNSTATVTSAGITGGTDIETVEAWRTRILARKRKPPHGGAEHDYVNWMKEVSGVTRAWVIPMYNGVGTLGCAFVRDDDASIIPTESQRDTVRNYIISHTDPATNKTVGIPVTAEPGLFMIELSEQSVDMTISLYPNTAAVRAEVEAEIEEIIKSDGGPNEVIYISRLSSAISNAAGEERHRIESPVADISASSNKVHVLGTITWQDY